MPFPWPSSPRVARVESFAQLARAFSDWCRAEPRGEASEARAALRHLSRLHAAALELELPADVDADLDGARADDAECRRVYERMAALPVGYYSEVADPGAVPSEEPVVGDLGDDVEEVYRDLSEGLSLLDAGHAAEAEWSFAESFRSHWGAHAAAAIRVLHLWLAERGELGPDQGRVL